MAINLKMDQRAPGERDRGGSGGDEAGSFFGPGTVVPINEGGSADFQRIFGGTAVRGDSGGGAPVGGASGGGGGPAAADAAVAAEAGGIDALTAGRLGLTGMSLVNAFTGGQDDDFGANRIESGLSAALGASSGIPEGLASAEQVIASQGAQGGNEANAGAMEIERARQLAAQNLDQQTGGAGLMGSSAAAAPRGSLEAAAAGQQLGLRERLANEQAARARGDLGSALGTAFINPALSISTGQNAAQLAAMAKPREASSFEQNLGFALSGLNAAGQAGAFGGNNSNPSATLVPGSFQVT